jgi:phosphoserine phosphatase RsbU/P
MNAVTTTDEKNAHELQAKKLQLHWLLQITKAINYNLPSANLFEIYKTVLHDHLNVKKLLLFVKEETWNIPVHFGLNGDLPLLGEDEILSEINNFSQQNNKASAWVKQFETIVPVIHQDTPLAYALIQGIDPSLFNSKREVITYIHTITNVITVAIENKRLAKESIRQAAMQRELELAAEMQNLLFPSSLVSHSFLDIAATYIPHQSVGGDYYDFIPVNDNEAYVCMADVSGKGVPAALLMSNFQANLHALLKHTNTSLEHLVVELNSCVNKSAQGEKFITFFIARINNIDKQIQYINAGHNPPMVIIENEIQILDKGTTGLGMFEELPFLNSGTISFPAGALLFCYTDGITEMENSRGEFFGQQLLAEHLIKYNTVSTMDQFHEIMVNCLNDFREETSFNDDVTFLSLRISK